jgi:hypothetical protein
MSEKLRITFIEKQHEEKNVSYEDLVREVDMIEMTAEVYNDDCIALEIEYDTNYTKKELEKIIDYYELDKRNKKKGDLVESIVLFEKDPINIEVVHKRKRLWSYIREIKDDKYLSKYLIFD